VFTETFFSDRTIECLSVNISERPTFQQILSQDVFTEAKTFIKKETNYWRSFTPNFISDSQRLDSWLRASPKMEIIGLDKFKILEEELLNYPLINFLFF